MDELTHIVDGKHMGWPGAAPMTPRAVAAARTAGIFTGQC
jgi:hypothetical protein